MEAIVQQLIDALGKDSVLTREEAALRPDSVWKNPGSLNVRALLLPTSTEAVSTALRLCHAAGQPVVPHGGLSNVVNSAAAGPADIALSLERMQAIEAIDIPGKTITLQAGAVLQQVQQAAAEKGLLFPLDLGAKGSCTIGGNIATNAGGLQALRYGVMRQLVLGLEVVLADGSILSSLNKMMKNNAGYDLKHWFIGSEGTLGIVTRAVLKLEDAPKTRSTAFVAAETFDQVVQFLNLARTRLAGTLTSYELLWRDYYCLMTTPPAAFRPPLPQTYPYYILLEARGQDPQNDDARFEQLLEDCLQTGLISDAAPARSQQELAWFWGIREQVEFVFSKHHPVFLFDVSLPISDMEAYIDTIQTRLRSRWDPVHFYAFGHLGDGNLHLYVCCGAADTETRHAVEELVYLPLQAIGGSVSAEHGIGLEKKAWLQLSRSETEIQWMKTIKQALDPKGILNPGKIF